MGVQCGSAIHLHVATPTQCHPAAATRQVDGRRPPAYLHQPPYPTTLTIRDDNVDVSRAKLPQPFLLRGVGWRGDQYPDPRDPCP
jgi:hypothetical protein